MQINYEATLIACIRYIYDFLRRRQNIFNWEIKPSP